MTGWSGGVQASMREQESSAEVLPRSWRMLMRWARCSEKLVLSNTPDGQRRKRQADAQLAQERASGGGGFAASQAAGAGELRLSSSLFSDSDDTSSLSRSTPREGSTREGPCGGASSAAATRGDGTRGDGTRRSVGSAFSSVDWAEARAKHERTSERQRRLSEIRANLAAASSRWESVSFPTRRIAEIRAMWADSLGVALELPYPEARLKSVKELISFIEQ